jgi:hypothetical protein
MSFASPDRWLAMRDAYAPGVARWRYAPIAINFWSVAISRANKRHPLCYSIT